MQHALLFDCMYNHHLCYEKNIVLFQPFLYSTDIFLNSTIQQISLQQTFNFNILFHHNMIISLGLICISFYYNQTFH